MPSVTAPTDSEARSVLDHAVTVTALMAFGFDCRLAARIVTMVTGEAECTITWEFVVLSPGEVPEGRGWTLYEDRSGIAVGRSI